MPPLPYLPIPLPPIAVPWPSPTPGVGTPVPTPAPMPSVIAPSIIGTAPTPAYNGPDPLDALLSPFRFSLDWRFLGALLFMLLTVWLVDEVWPEYVWPYVGILLLGLTLVNTSFGPGLNTLIGA